MDRILFAVFNHENRNQGVSTSSPADTNLFDVTRFITRLALHRRYMVYCQPAKRSPARRQGLLPAKLPVGGTPKRLARNGTPV